MDALWRIRLLGSLRAEGSQREVTRFRTQKTAALLAYLAYYRDRSHPRELLMEILWPEDDLDAARNKLRLALSSLRRQLEPPGTPAGTVITADRALVALNPHLVNTDVAEFQVALGSAMRTGSDVERALLFGQAVELYRGELLPGHHAVGV
jgi:DNA-binding SARP family transcriptional activator